MNEYIQNEIEIIDSFLKRIENIKEEMKELENTAEYKEYTRLKKTEPVREHKKLEREKEFYKASILNHRSNLEKINNSYDNNSKTR